MSTDLVIIVLIIIIGGALLVTWWYSVAVIRPRVRKARHEIFQAYVQARSGQEIPLPNMDSLTFFDSFSQKGRDLQRQAEQAHPQLGTQNIYSDHQASVRVSDRDGRVAFGEAGESEEYVTKIIFWQITLKGAVDGWARLRSATSRFKGALPEVNLESVEFNRDIQVHAHPKKLAFTLFAPNVLEWYLQTSHQPWVYVDQNRLIVVFETYPQPGVFEKLEGEVEYLIQAVERSGALEKN